MIYYAWLKQSGEGCDYTIGCGNTLRTIKANTDDEARTKLKEIIMENYYGEQELERALLFKSPIDFDLDEVYTEMAKKEEEERNSRQHIKDMEEFERLRKKLGKTN